MVRKSKTLLAVALGAGLVLAIAFMFFEHAPPPPPQAQQPPGLSPEEKEANELLFRNQVRDEALSRAREEQQEHWEQLRRDQVVAAPITEALEQAQTLEGTIKRPSPATKKEQRKVPESQNASASEDRD